MPPPQPATRPPVTGAPLAGAPRSFGADPNSARRPNIAALSPAVAASLAKLAGTTAAAQARRSVLRPDDATPAEPPPRDAGVKRGTDAAE